MQAQRLTRDRLPHYQRGVTTLFAVLMMLSLLTFVAVVTDTGRLYLEKRSLQKNADLAAMETALRYCRDKTMDDSELSNSAINVLTRNNFKGIFSEGENTGNSIVAVVLDNYAVTVELTYAVRASLFEQLLPNHGDVNLTARATAKACEPSAQLSIRSNLINISSENSLLLNSLLGGLLGTTLNLGIADWESLIDTNINLLNYFDAIATELNLEVGDYDGVLSTEISLGELINIAADVLQTNGNIAAISALDLLSVNIPGATPLIELGDLLNIQAGSESSALDANLQLIQLVKGVIQLANRESGINAAITANLGVANADLRIKITEKPVFSAIGNPDLAKQDPYGNDAIFVRSAQVKVLASLNLPIGNTLNFLLNNSLISTITTVTNDLLSLNLIGLLHTISCTVYCEKDVIDIQILPSPNLDILITAGQAEGRFIDHSCDNSGTEKTLRVDAQSSVAKVALGKMDPDNAMSSNELIVDVVPIIDIGKRRVACGLLLICGPISPRNAFVGGGLGLKINQPENFDPPESDSLLFANIPDETNLPEVGQEFTENAYQTVNSQGVLNDTVNILSGVEFTFYEPENIGIGGDGLGTAVYLLGNIINPVLSGLTNILSSVLAPLLDLILNNVLNLLGVSLAEAEIGSALTCENDKVRLTN